MIQTVKLQGNGYLLNGSMHVPKADGNREYEAIKQWIAEGNAPEPEYTEEELQAKQISETIAHFKSLYLGVVDAKLKELDYDSLATVNLWEGDAVFGDEATAILNWYKAIINYNYEVLNEVKLGNRQVPTDEEYLAGIPVL